MQRVGMGLPSSQSRAQTEGSHHHPRLLAVLLVDALETLGRAPHGAGAREVRDWVCASEADGSAFSFARACDTLGLPVVRLRRRLGLRGQVPRRGTSRGLMRRGRAPYRPVT